MFLLFCAFPEREQVDFAGAVIADGDAGGACAAAGVAGHFSMIPESADTLSGCGGGIDDGRAAGQADLAAVGVAGEVEVDVSLGGLGVQFRRMGQENLEVVVV